MDAASSPRHAAAQVTSSSYEGIRSRLWRELKTSGPSTGSGHPSGAGRVPFWSSDATARGRAEAGVEPVAAAERITVGRVGRDREVPPGWRPIQNVRRRADLDAVKGMARRGLSVTLESTPFFRLGRAHVLSVAGDTCVTLALAGSLFFDLSPSAARGKVALSLILTVLPFGIVAPFLGPLIDRARGGRRWMLVGAAVGRSVLCVIMAGHVDGLVLFPLVLCSLVLSKAHGVAKASLVPTTVGAAAELVGANSRLAMLAGVAGFAAAVPAGLVLKIGFLGAGWTLRLGAVVFLAAAIASWQVRVQPTHRGADTDDPAVGMAIALGLNPAGAGVEVDEGPGGRRPQPILAASTLPALTSMAVLRGIVGFVGFEVAFAFRRSGTANVWIGVVLGASAIGNLVGAVVAPRLRKRLSEEPIVLGSLGLVALAALVVIRAPDKLSVAALALAVGTSAAAARLAFDSLVQRDNPQSVQARAFSRFEALFQVVWVAGALAPILLTLSLRAAGVVVCGTAAAGAVAYGSELRAASSRHHRSRPPDDDGSDPDHGPVTVSMVMPPGRAGLDRSAVTATTPVPCLPGAEFPIPPLDTQPLDPADAETAALPAPWRPSA